MTDQQRTPSIVREQHGRVVQLRMNRPEMLNVLNEELAENMLSAFQDVATDRSVRVVMLTGAGRSFMAGGDLTCFKADLPGAPKIAGRLIDLFHGIMRSIKTMEKPVIAVVHGPVAGGGLGLALACDLIVAADNTSFLSAYTKLGTTPDGGTSWSLTRLLGARRALAFMLLNERMNASEALELGLVNHVVPLGELSTAALSLAESLAATCAAATAGVKRLTQTAQTGTFDQQLDLEKSSFVDAAATADFAEGINAFFERRTPRFE